MVEGAEEAVAEAVAAVEGEEEEEAAVEGEAEEVASKFTPIPKFHKLNSSDI